jgi:hypothetical protein
MSGPVASWRRWLAYQLVAGHGLGMFIVFAAPLQFYLLYLAKEHLSAALLAGAAMVIGFAGTLWLAPSVMAVSSRPVRRGTTPWRLLRLIRSFVGNGDAIQAAARWIDPEWQNPYAGRSAEETSRWLSSMELMHWATLAASVAPICAAIIFQHELLYFSYIAGNLLYNIAPNLVIRETRRRLLRISQRNLAPRSDGVHWQS